MGFREIVFSIGLKEGWGNLFERSNGRLKI